MSATSKIARKIILPCFVLTEACCATDEGAEKLSIVQGDTTLIFYQRPQLMPSGNRLDGKAKWRRSQFNLYPVIQRLSGVPWEVANLYLLDRLSQTPNVDMSTFDGIADDLVGFRRFLDEEDIDWQNFPMHKLSRPTYRYDAHMVRMVKAGQTTSDLASRRTRSVIAFYRWAIEKGLCTAVYKPWQERNVLLTLADSYGGQYVKTIKTTDLAKKAPRQDDPYTDTIQDDGQLRPLPVEEQGWVLEALFARNNPEMTLIHLFGFLTGGRIQTILTFRLRHIKQLKTARNNRPASAELRVPVGHGTGVDTKRDKKMTLHIPLWFAEMLQTYAQSERAQRRRRHAKGGDTDEQYLFLTKSGIPYYKSKQESAVFDPASKRRQPIKGNSIRKFIGDVIVPYIQSRHDSGFKYQFHDLKATFGMNLMNSQLELVAKGKKTFAQAMNYVRVRLGHNSLVVTNRYVNHRENEANFSMLADRHNEHLRTLTERAGKYGKA